MHGKSFFKASSIGFLFICTLLFFAGVGFFIDKKLGTMPLFFMSGFILGFIGALINVFKFSNKLLEDDKDYKGKK